MNLTSVQAAAYLLDSYSGAAAAYSLRRLSTAYTGSAIRVRRSSDNTELNIGFDSDGNLDTVALSAFVGTGNGFVTTWYDQSGNGREAIQTTAGNQPKIVINGVLNTLGTKAAINFDGSGDSLNSPYTQGSTNEMYLVTQTSDTYFVYPTNGLSTYGYVAQNGSTSTALYSNYGTPQLFTNGVLRTPVNRGDVYNILNGYKLVTHKNFSMSGWPSGYPTIIGVYSGSADYNGNVQEWLIYPTLQSSQSSIESNINSYYSVYPNPTSVWNLLAAAYNADTTASSSLKTSLFAAYNGESNANDSFGTNNGTAVGGLTYGTGKIGNAFSFNGTNAYVSLPNSSGQFNFTGDFSVSMWFKSSNLSTSRYAIGNYKSGGSNGYGWQLYYSVVGGFAFDLRNGNNINQVRKTQTINTNTWYHVVAVRKMGQIHKLYVNGVDVSAPQTDGNVNNIAGYTANQPMDLGGLSDANAPALCDLDGVNMWNKALTQSEITELYNSGNGAQYIGDNFYKPTTNDALNTNNGTAVGGLTYGLGKVGTAFQFNGTNAYVTLPNSSGQFNFTGDFSISCWFKSNTISGNQMIFSNLMYNGGTRKGYYIILASNTIGCWFINQPTHNQEFYTSAVVSINTWYHLSVTRESGVVKIYLNGTLLATDTNAIPLAYVTTLTSIGAYTNATGSTFAYFNGSIDAFNIWQKALTQTEVTELYNSGNGKQYPN